MISAVHEKVSRLLTKLIARKCKNTLQRKDKIITGELKMINNKFAIVPIDKASGNIG